jgi:hypothetical protein
MNNQTITLPQELIDYIVFLSDYQVQIGIRDILTDYVYKLLTNYTFLVQNKGISISDVIINTDIEVLNINITLIKQLFQYILIDLIIIHSTVENVEILMNWARENGYEYSFLTFITVLNLDAQSSTSFPLKTNIVLKTMHKHGYKFTINTQLINIASLYSNIPVISFLNSIGTIIDHNIITNIPFMYSEYHNIIKLINLNIGNTQELCCKVFSTRNTEFILRMLNNTHFSLNIVILMKYFISHEIEDEYILESLQLVQKCMHHSLYCNEINDIVIHYYMYNNFEIY